MEKTCKKCRKKFETNNKHRGRCNKCMNKTKTKTKNVCPNCGGNHFVHKRVYPILVCKLCGFNREVKGRVSDDDYCSACNEQAGWEIKKFEKNDRRKLYL